MTPINVVSLCGTPGLGITGITAGLGGVGTPSPPTPPPTTGAGDPGERERWEKEILRRQIAERAARQKGNAPAPATPELLFGVVTHLAGLEAAAVATASAFTAGTIDTSEVDRIVVPAGPPGAEVPAPASGWALFFVDESSLYAALGAEDGKRYLVVGLTIPEGGAPRGRYVVRGETIGIAAARLEA